MVLQRKISAMILNKQLLLPINMVNILKASSKPFKVHHSTVWKIIHKWKIFSVLVFPEVNVLANVH